jgi:chaperonin GroES
MKENKFEPLEDRVVILPIEEKDAKTDAGLFIPDTIRKEVKKGEVYAIGFGRYANETGQLIPTILHAGDIVLYGASQGIEITIDKQDMRVMREGDVIMRISTENRENTV